MPLSHLVVEFCMCPPAGQINLPQLKAAVRAPDVGYENDVPACLCTASTACDMQLVLQGVTVEPVD